jgi:hypothetical protein
VIHLSNNQSKKQILMFKRSFLGSTAMLVASFFILSSSKCKKDDPIVKTKAELLTQTAWKITKLEARASTAAPWTDYTGFLQSCDKDNPTIFRSNATYEINEGATKCSPTDPQIVEAGTWVFENSETRIKFTQTGGIPYTGDIELLSEANLILTSSETSGGVTTYVRTTMAH